MRLGLLSISEDAIYDLIIQSSEHPTEIFSPNRSATPLC